MTEHDQHLIDRLAAVAETEVPPPDHGFVERLESALRLQHAQRGAPVHRPLRRPVMVGAFFAVLLLGIVGSLAWLGQGDVDELVVVAAVDTRVVLADGTVIAAQPGLVLPDGAQVFVGSDGVFEVDGDRLAPGEEARVINGRLEVVGRGADVSRSSTTAAGTATTQVDSTDTTASTLPPASDTTDGSQPPTTPSTVSSTTTGATDRTTIPSTTSATDGRSTTDPPRTSRTTSDVISSTSPTSPTSSTGSTGPGIDRVVLSIDVLADGRLHLTWTSPSVDVDGWEVRAGAGDRRRTIAVLRDADARTLTITPGQEGLTYWVLGRVDGGEVVVESNRLEP